MMRIGDLVSRDVEVVESSELAGAAWRRMKQQRFNHLVVVEAGQIVGVVSSHDLTRLGASGRQSRTVGEIMSADVVTASPSMPVHKAAQIMRGRMIGCLPVVNNGRLVGILSMSDLLDWMSEHRVHPASPTPWASMHQKTRANGPARRSRGTEPYAHG